MIEPATQPAEAIDYFSLGNRLRRPATRAALRARTKMYELFESVVPYDPWSTIVDVGVTPDRSLPDSNFFERLYPFPERITATSIEDASFLEFEHPGLRFVHTDGDSLPFATAEFDIGVSFAVLEHVGDRDAQQRFLAELCRVSRHVFLTTPNRWFPIELHTLLPMLHWLPQPMHQKVLRGIGKGFWAETANLNLLSASAITSMFPPGVDLHLSRYRTAGWCSNLVLHGRVR
jgi:SAM-dependent methyltransferase